MIWSRALLILAAGLVAGLVGWLNPPRADPPVQAVRRSHVPSLTQPGGAANTSAESARFLAALNTPPPPPPPPPPPKPPPPPPPDPAVLLKAALVAVMADSRGLYLLMSSDGADGHQQLRAGATFAGWKIVSIERHQVVLRQGVQQRTVALFAPQTSVREDS